MSVEQSAVVVELDGKKVPCLVPLEGQLEVALPAELGGELRLVHTWHKVDGKKIHPKVFIHPETRKPTANLELAFWIQTNKGWSLRSRTVKEAPPLGVDYILASEPEPDELTQRCEMLERKVEALSARVLHLYEELGVSA